MDWTEQAKLNPPEGLFFKLSGKSGSRGASRCVLLDGELTRGHHHDVMAPSACASLIELWSVVLCNEGQVERVVLDRQGRCAGWTEGGVDRGTQCQVDCFVAF